MLLKLEKKEKILKTSSDIKDWNDILHDLHAILKEYDDFLPAEVRDTLSKLAQITDTSPDMMRPSYEAMKTGLEQATNTIPIVSAGGLSSKLIALIAVAVVLSGGAAYVATSGTAHLYITNNNCATLNILDMPVPIPGITINDSFISAGNTGRIDIVAMSVILDSTDRTNLELRSTLAPDGISIQLPNNVQEITLNGVGIFGTQYEANFEKNQDYNFVVSC
ncbi:MAG: hypothetical protein AB1608_05635 [Thermoproteota archaeon]